MVQCSVMSANHSSFGALAVKSRPTWSSCTAEPERVFLPRCLALTNENQPSAEQIRHAVLLAMGWPASRASSSRNRCPYSGSSRYASNNVFAQYASISSLSLTGLACHRQYGCRASFNTRQVTATGILDCVKDSGQSLGLISSVDQATAAALR